MQLAYDFDEIGSRSQHIGIVCSYSIVFETDLHHLSNL